MELSGIEKAIIAVKTQAALAELMGVKQQTVSLWLKQGWVPEDRVIECAMHTGVPRAELLDPAMVARIVGMAAPAEDVL